MTKEDQPNNASSKARFAPKVPSTRIKKEEAIKLGSKTAIQEVRQKQSTEQHQTNNIQKRKERSSFTGLLATSDVQGPFSLGPAACVKFRNADATSASIREGSKGSDSSRDAISKAQQQLPSADTDIRSAVSVESYNDIDGKAPIVIRNHGDQTTESGSLIEMFEGQLVLVKLPVKMPLIEFMPRANEIPNSKEEEPVERTVDLDSLKQAEQATRSKCSPFTSPWPSTAHGKLGKVRRYASGKMTIIVGDIEFELVSVKNSTSSVTNALIIDGEYNQAFDLGNIKTRLVAIPDVSKLLL